MTKIKEYIETLKGEIEHKFDKIEANLEKFNPAEGHIKFLADVKKFKKKIERSKI